MNLLLVRLVFYANKIVRPPGAPESCGYKLVVLLVRIVFARLPGKDSSEGHNATGCAIFFLRPVVKVGDVEGN